MLDSLVTLIISQANGGYRQEISVMYSLCRELKLVNNLLDYAINYNFLIIFKRRHHQYQGRD